MSSSSASSSTPLLSCFTASVGFHQAGHALPDKLRAIAEAGFQGVEIFQDDLDAFADSEQFAQIYKALTPPPSPHALNRGLEQGDGASSSQQTETDADATTDLAAWNAHGPCSAWHAQREQVCATYVGDLCRSLGLQVLTLQPMRDVEGWRSKEHQEAAMQRVRSRFPILRALGTDLLICCSNCQPEDQIVAADDVDAKADVLRQLADEAAQYNQTNEGNSTSTTLKPLRIALEGLSWGTHIDRWDQAYAVVQRVNRDNFGLCLDGFNTLGRQFADPCSPTGIQEPEADTRQALQASLTALQQQVQPDKVFFLQVGDARKLKQALAPSPNAEEPRPARMIWSRANRLYPGEFDLGAFMPTVDFVNAVHATGYRGPWSIEVFNSSLSEAGVEVQRSHAQRAIKGLRWLVDQVVGK